LRPGLSPGLPLSVKNIFSFQSFSVYGPAFSQRKQKTFPLGNWLPTPRPLTASWSRPFSFASRTFVRFAFVVEKLNRLKTIHLFIPYYQ
jgi:hypothetical protein